MAARGTTPWTTIVSSLRITGNTAHVSICAAHGTLRFHPILAQEKYWRQLLGLRSDSDTPVKEDGCPNRRNREPFILV